MRRNRTTELRVGLFVLIALAVTALVSFVIGKQRNVFETKTTYFVYFDDVGGLRAGSPVRLSGVSVGTVSSVDLQDDGRILVRFRVVDRAAHLIRGTPEQCTLDARLRQDAARRADEGRRKVAAAAGKEPPPPARLEQCTVASLDSKGLLGDRLIDLGVGAELPPWDPEQPLPTGGTSGMQGAIDGAIETLDSVNAVARDLRSATAPLADQKLTEDLKTTMGNLEELSDRLTHGEGALQRLISDPSTSDQIAKTLDNLSVASEELAKTAQGVRAITDEVRTGDGSAHELIYGQEGKKTIASLGRAADEVATLLKDVRTSEGTVHDLIYEDSANELLANLNKASADIAAITSDVRKGRGTLGALITDPSIYEDVKRLVGDLERNEVLRALVRYSIQQEESRKKVEVKPASTPKPAPSP